MLMVLLALGALAAEAPEDDTDDPRDIARDIAREPDTAPVFDVGPAERDRTRAPAAVRAQRPPAARIDPRTGKDYDAVARAELELLQQSTHEPLQPLSRDQHRWLKPARHRLPPNPYGNTDYTAYTLEFGEVKLGLASMTVGVLPHTQLGTVPALNAVGIYNGHAKVNMFRIQGFDLALKGALHWLPLGEFDGNYLELGLFASQILHPRVSVHGGMAYSSMSAKGVPDLTKASPLITMVTGDLSAYNPPEEWFGDNPPRIRAEALAARVAVDVRINRRDSFVLQGQALLQAAVVSDLGEVAVSEVLPPIAGLDEALSYKERFRVTDAYVVSLAYQASWKQVDLRIGAGLSSVPGAWVVQANELSYRFGGKTRRTEARQRRTWRRNRRDVGPAVAPPPPPPLPGAEE